MRTEVLQAIESLQENNDFKVLCKEMLDIRESVLKKLVTKNPDSVSYATAIAFLQGRVAGIDELFLLLTRASESKKQSIFNIFK